MTKRILFLLIIIQLTYQQCGSGCLKCNSLNKCLICDITQNYYMNSTAGCFKNSNITNCQQANQLGLCVSCNNGFYLDQNTQLCLSVPAANIIPNCLSYNSLFACQYCSGAFYVNLAGCVASTLTIPNCQYYSGNGTCGACATGYIFSSNFSSCNQLPSGGNCLMYTYAACSNCGPNTIINQNLYFSSLLNVQTQISTLVKSIGSASWNSLQICQPVNTTLNCATFTSFNICASCVSGYYFSNSLCIQNPLPAIQNCSIYSTATTCTSCIANNFLSGGVCVFITPIPFCVTYSTTATSAVCTSCNATSFVSNNLCVNRTNSLNIANCAILSLTSDTCGSCNPGQIMINNGLLCVPAIANCFTFTTNSATSTCTACIAGFYLSSAQPQVPCVQGTIPNCQTYSQSLVNACTVCNNGWYLSGNLCLPHVVIPNCKNFSPTTANTCAVCMPGFFNFAITQICVPVNPIANCAVYNANQLSCQTCSPGFYFVGTACTLIPISFGLCQVLSNSVCQTCFPGNVLNNVLTSQPCIPTFDYVKANCGTAATLPASTVILTGTSQCTACGPNSYPYIPRANEAICVLNSDLNSYQNFAPVNNCVRYGLNFVSGTKTVVCMECAANNFINNYWGNVNFAAPTGCQLGCITSNGGNVIIPDDLAGFRNICIITGNANPLPAGQIAAANCAKYARISARNGGVVSSSFTVADYYCMQYTFLMFNLANTSFDPNLAAFYVWEQNSIPSNAIVTSVTDFASPYALLDTGASPSIFNYRGVNVAPVQVSQIPATTLANCDIAFPLGRGSAYATTVGGGAFASLSGTSGNPGCCLRCKPGWQPVYVVTTATGNSNIPVCQTMGSTCSSPSTILGGLPSYLNAVISCHSCASVSNGATPPVLSPTYPTIFMEYAAVGGSFVGQFLNWAFPTVTGTTANANHGFRCLVPPTTVSIGATSTTNNQVANCAAYGVLSAVTTLSTTPATTVSYCLACASGFFPVYLGSTIGTTATGPNFPPNYIVTSCTASLNCDTNPPNKPYNSCGRCSLASQSATPPVNFAYSDFRLINCLPTPFPNCFIISASGSSASSTSNPCGVCMSGYILNGDSNCEAIQIPNNSTGSSFTQAYFFRVFSAASNPSAAAEAPWVRIHYLLSFFNWSYGISACNANYIPAPASPYANTLCVWSPYVNNTKTALPTGSVFLANCAQYSATLSGANSNVFLCAVCTTGFIPKADLSACVAAGTVSNCVLAQSNTATLCQQCATGFFNINGVCTNTPIANCFSYPANPTAPMTSLTCTQCQPGYSLSSNSFTCTLGSILNCAQYTVNSLSACTQCLPNFSLVTLLNSVVYCYPLSGQFSNCNVFSNFNSNSGSGMQQGIINCQSCINTPNQMFGPTSFSLSVNPTQAQTVCLGFNPINNCLDYNQYNSLVQNTLTCTSCASGFFLATTTGTCVARTVNFATCLTYSNTADLCSSCATGFYVAANGLSCLPNPTGIPFCTVYSSLTTCTTCQSGYFLSSTNTCILSTVVPNCVTYSANYTCTQCISGQFLVNSTSCQVPTALNCVSASSLTVCATCASGFGLNNTGNVTNCIAISISNCAVTTTTFPFSCVICNTGFYLVNGTCTAVTALISNCLYYATNATCANCSSGYILLANQTACSQSLFQSYGDSSCVNSYLLSQPTCSVCTPGYFFVNGVCTACTQNTAASGCTACNMFNQSQCLWCCAGYYMNQNGTCIQIPVTIPPTIFTSAFSISIRGLVLVILFYLNA